MDDVELKKLVSRFCKGLTKRGSKSMCYAACLPLQGLISYCGGIETKLIEGVIKTKEGNWQHFWLEHPDGRIIDPTANQFNDITLNKKMPRVYIGAKPEWYKTKNE